MMHPFKVYEDIILTEVSFLSRYISRMEPFKTVWGITFLAASFGFIKSQRMGNASESLSQK